MLILKHFIFVVLRSNIVNILFFEKKNIFSHAHIKIIIK